MVAVNSLVGQRPTAKGQRVLSIYNCLSTQHAFLPGVWDPVWRRRKSRGTRRLRFDPCVSMIATSMLQPSSAMVELMS